MTGKDEVLTPDGVLETDVIDVPIDALGDTGNSKPSNSQDTGLPNLDLGQKPQGRNQPSKPDPMDMTPIKLLNYVMKRGCLMFNDGQMLTKCPGYGKPAICPMYPLPHPDTGDPIMVCAGPSIYKTSKGGLFTPKETVYKTKRPHRSCPYHPERINEPVEYDKDESSEDGGSGWL